MRPQLRIIRVHDHERFGTFGMLVVNSLPFCMTLEPPDRENQIGQSSIPSGQYTCRSYTSEKYPETFEVTNVPGRTAILFHAGNVAEHTKGCILLGEKLGKLRAEGEEQLAILNSGATFKKFLRWVNPAKALDLTIVEVF